MTMNFRRFSIGALAVLVLAACGGDPTAALESASSVTVAPGGSTTLSVNLNRSNAPKGAFSFAIAGLPSGVTATFDPASAEADVERISLTFAATRDAERGAFLLTLTATGPGSNPLVATTPIALEVRGISVRGKVLAAMLGEPVPGAQVRVGGVLAVTNAHGEFAVDDVSLPYDLTVGFADFFAETYPGLTTDKPVVRSLFGAEMLNPNSTSLDVVLPAPIPENQLVRICASGIDGVVSGCTTEWPGTTETSLQIRWAGTSARRQVKITAYAYSDGEAGVTAIHGFAESATFTVEDGETPPELEVAWGAAPATSTSTLDFLLPDWAEIGGQMTVAPLNGDHFAILGAPAIAGPAIVFQGAPQFLIAYGETTMGVAWRPSTSTSTSPLTFPSAPELITIPDDLSGEFVLSAHAPGELSIVGLVLSGRPIFVHTTTDRFRLPDLTGFAGHEPLEFNDTMLLARASNIRSMDDAVTEAGLLDTFFNIMSGSVAPNITSEGALTFATSVF